jgi:hypothetical protein
LKKTWLFIAILLFLSSAIFTLAEDLAETSAEQPVATESTPEIESASEENSAVETEETPEPENIDTTSPDPVTNLIATPSDAKIDLTWQNPTEDFEQVLILQVETSTTITLENGKNYTIGETINTATIIFIGNAENFSAKNLTNEAEYFFQIFTQDSALNYSTSNTISAIPIAPVVIPNTANSYEVIISEIAWSGTEASPSDEWIELQNLTDQTFDLTNWQILATDGSPEITLEGQIEPFGFFLLERTDDNTVPTISADQIYTGSLSNDGEDLQLIDSAGAEIDRANFADGWTVGNSDTRQPAARLSDETWQTALDTGTPKAKNFLDYDLSLTEITFDPVLPLPNSAVEFTAKIENYGLNTVENFQIEWKINDIIIEVETIEILASFTTLEKKFTQTFDSGEQEISAEIIFSTDEESSNNTQTQNFSVEWHLLISEFIPNPEDKDEPSADDDISSAEWEWIELFNPTDTTIDLTGFQLVNENGALEITTGEIAANEFILISAAVENGLSWTGTWPTFSNSDGTIELFDPENNLLDFAEYAEAIEQKSFGRNLADFTWTEFWHPTPNATNLIPELNQTPAAQLEIQGSGDTTGNCSLYVNLTGENSTDPDNDSLEFFWDFGNGETSEEENPAGFYFYSGDYTVQLTVRDILDATHTATQNFSVSTSCSSSSGGASSASIIIPEPTFDSISADAVIVKITEVSFNATNDFVEIKMLDDGNNGAGVDLGGFYFEDDKNIKTIPLNTILKSGEFLTLTFKSEASDNLETKQLFSTRNGLTATDEQIILKDSTGKIEDAVVWENRNGAWSRYEDTDVENLVSAGAWNSSETTVALDSSKISREIIFARFADDRDTNSAADFFITPFATPGQINGEPLLQAQDVKIKITEVALKNPSGDWIKLACSNCAEPINLAGFYLQFGTSKIFQFPLTSKISSDQPVEIWLNKTAEEIPPNSNTFFATYSGLRGTDGLLSLKDFTRATVDFVGWSDRVAPDSREQDLSEKDQTQLTNFFQNQHWNSAEANSLIDSNKISRNDIIFREQNRDTNSIADWKIRTPILEEFEEKIEEPEFEIEEPEFEEEPEAIQTQTSENIKISEILSNPAGRDTGQEWFELINQGNEPIELFSWKIKSGKSKLQFTESTILQPSEFRIFTSLTLRNQGGTLELVDPNEKIIDLVEFPKLAENLAFARSESGEFFLTEITTPNETNLIFQNFSIEEDSDHDGLANSVENFIQTNPQNFDTDADQLPDAFEIYHGTNPLIADADKKSLAKYSAWLTKLAAKKVTSEISAENGLLLTGHGTPGSTVKILIHSDLITAEVLIDDNGNWNYELDQTIKSGEHNVFLQIIDPIGFESEVQKILNFKLDQDFIPPIFSEKIIVSEILPNPKGKDAENEFIELENRSDEIVDLSGYQILHGKNFFEFPANTILQPNEFRAFFSAGTNLNLRNTGGEIKLFTPKGKIISEFIYPKAKDNRAFALFNTKILETKKPTPNLPNKLISPNVKKHKNQNGTLSAEIEISEILANPDGKDTKDNEFVEIFNAGAKSVNLGNWRLVDASGRGANLPDTLWIQPNEYKILPKSLTKITLNNSGMELVELRDFQGKIIDMKKFFDAESGISLARDDTGKFRNTRIITPNQMNEFDTKILIGSILFRGQNGFVIMPKKGALRFVCFSFKNKDLARAFFIKNEWKIFVREEQGKLFLDDFELFSANYENDISKFDGFNFWFVIFGICLVEVFLHFWFMPKIHSESRNLKLEFIYNRKHN